MDSLIFGLFIPHLPWFTFSLSSFFFFFLTAATQISLASFDERGQIFFPSAPTPDLFLIPTENWAHSSLFQSKLPGGASRESGPASFLIYLLLKEIRIPFAFRGAAHHRVHLMITGRLLLRFRDRHGSKKGMYSCGFEARIWITKKRPWDGCLNFFFFSKAKCVLVFVSIFFFF